MVNHGRPKRRSVVHTELGRLALALGLGLVACGGAPAKAPSVHPMLGELRASAKKAGPVAAERVAVLPETATPITFARMAKYPEPGWNVPRAPQHAPDGRSVTFLASESGDETMSLFAFDVATGKSEVLLRAKDLGDTSSATRSREEELRRERQRDRNEGITSHLWARRSKVLVVPNGGDIYVRDFVKEPQGRVRRLTKTPDAEIDPKPCDTGEKIAFVRKGELWVIDVATGKETRVTSPVKPTNAPEDGTITHGLSDYVAQEELGESSGFFWSPKCDRIAYLEVDERPVAKLPVLGFRGDPDLMMQRYPRAGAANPLVRAGVVDLATRTTTWLTAPDRAPGGPSPVAAKKREAKADPDRYLGRFAWSEDGKSLFYQTLSRDQKRVALVRADPSSGVGVELAVETHPAWVSFSPIRLVARGERLVWTTTKNGHRHLELLRQTDGAVLAQLTEGAWDVEGIVGVDEARETVLFTATRESPIERQLYATPMSGGKTTIRLTAERGVHAVRADEAGSTWVDVHSATDRPPRAVVVRDGNLVGALPLAADPEIQTLALRPTEPVTIRAADGEVLHGAVLKPRQITGRHPAIVMVYGGPETQLVFDSWAPKLLWQHLADRGFVVFQLDNRGSGGRGRGASQKVHKQLGRLELEDQIAGAAYLASLPYVDRDRIGIYGHSYGGYMAARAMLEGKGVFKVGVAGSPVTDWRLYDSGYTERFMETPQSNPTGYAESDLNSMAAGLTGKLLLTHAMMDENVHYAHTAKLVDALVAADKPFDLLALPGERHGLRAPAARAYVPERIVRYFTDHL